MKNNKGINLITLTVAVCIMIIILSMLIYNAKNGVAVKSFKMMDNDIELLDDKINTYYVKYGALPAEIEYAGDIKFEIQPNDNEKYYVIDLNALENVTLNYGSDFEKITTSSDTITYNDVYIINEQSHHIYYAKGIEMDGITYYTNDTDELIELVNVE